MRQPEETGRSIKLKSRIDSKCIFDVVPFCFLLVFFFLFQGTLSCTGSFRAFCEVENEIFALIDDRGRK